MAVMLMRRIRTVGGLVMTLGAAMPMTAGAENFTPRVGPGAIVKAEGCQSSATNDEQRAKLQVILDGMTKKLPDEVVQELQGWARQEPKDGPYSSTAVEWFIVWGSLLAGYNQTDDRSGIHAATMSSNMWIQSAAYYILADIPPEKESGEFIRTGFINSLLNLNVPISGFFARGVAEAIIAYRDTELFSEIQRILGQYKVTGTMAVALVSAAGAAAQAGCETCEEWATAVYLQVQSPYTTTVILKTSELSDSLKTRMINEKSKLLDEQLGANILAPEQSAPTDNSNLSPQ